MVGDCIIIRPPLCHVHCSLDTSWPVDLCIIPILTPFGRRQDDATRRPTGKKAFGSAWLELCWSNEWCAALKLYWALPAHCCSARELPIGIKYIIDDDDVGRVLIVKYLPDGPWRLIRIVRSWTIHQQQQQLKQSPPSFMESQGLWKSTAAAALPYYISGQSITRRNGDQSSIEKVAGEQSKKHKRIKLPPHHLSL